jgi:two-component system sensor histidine kinase ChiS
MRTSNPGQIRMSKGEFPSLKYPILIIMIMVFTTSFMVFFMNSPIKENDYIAKGGLIDLRDWNIKEGKNIKLNGEWEFYPGNLLEPDTINELLAGLDKKYIKVPGNWGEFINNKGVMEGAGTYRLRILLPSDGIFAIKTRTIRLSSRVYLNGQEIISVGRPSKERENFIGKSIYEIGSGNSQNKEIDLIIQVSNFGYKTGGILSPIEFGTFKSIILTNNKDYVVNAMTIAACFVVAAYFLIIYLQRNKKPFLLYFSATSFIMAVYLSTMNEQLLNLLFDCDLAIRIKIQVTAMLLTSIGLLGFAHNFFPKYSNRKIVRLLTSICLTMLMLLFIDAGKLSPLLANSLQLCIILGYTVCYIKVLFIMVRAIIHKADSFGYILVITGSLIFYWILIAAKIIFEIYLGDIQAILILFMVIGAAALIMHRLNLDYINANALSEKLITYDRQKDEFLAKVSHELKTPLYIMTGLTRNLVEGRKGALNPKQQENLLFIYQEGQRLISLVVDMLNASQIKEGKVSLRVYPMNLHTIVDNILKEMQIIIPEDKSIILKNSISKDFPTIKGDADKFRQIIYNLVHNAIKFTKEGEVEISAIITDKKVKVKVRDTGIGIEEKNYDEIFNIFYQKNNGSNENNDPRLRQDLGLGLAIVKQLVEIQGGKISVESVYQKGTTFTFTLPSYEEDIEGNSQKEPVENMKIRSDTTKIISNEFITEKKDKIGLPKILLVDDELLNQKLIIDILEDLKWDIILADNGAKALDIVDTTKIDLIILDFMLPDISGDRVCKKIREKFSMTELPILILTASESTIDLMKGFEYGANDFQRKPIEPEELVSRINSLLLMKNAAAEGLEREFKYLYTQISPHFLYNTINTIIGLSYKDTEKTRKALNNLAIYFRGKLDVHREKGLVPLENELDLVRAYLEIEEMRYEDKIKIILDIEANLKVMIPPLTIQPIVENAIKHGIKSKKDKGVVRITAKKGKDEYINIIIEDNGVGMDLTKQAELMKGYSEQIGFKNVMEKIQQMNDGKIILESVEGVGTKVSIIIPKGKAYESNNSG